MPRSVSSTSNTLFEVRSSSSAGTAPTVFDALDCGDDTNLLVLSYRDSPEAWLRNWQATVGEFPEELGFVHAGAETRSASTVSSSATRPTPPATASEPSASRDCDSDAGVPLVDAVADPTDLARLGVRASEYIETWDGNGRETVVYLDSLTAMLDHVDLSRAFSFLHVLAGRVESVDGRGYYLFDPASHDEVAVGVVRELADAVVAVAHDGPA